MANKRQLNNYLFNGLLLVLSISGIVGFWLTEQNPFLHWAIIILSLVSLWQIYRKDTSAILFVVGFLNSSVLFKLSSDRVIPYNLAAVLIFAIVLFLFNYRGLQYEHINLKKFFSIYNSLLGLLIAELFYILTFFPIEAKNKAILIVLFLWLYDEFVESYDKGTLNRQFVVRTSLIFAVLFIALVVSFPFQPGL